MRLRPTPQEALPKDYAIVDLNINILMQMVSPGFPNPKYARLLCQEADPLFLMQSLHARFSADDIERMQAALQSALYGIADLSGSSLARVRDTIALGNPSRKPFDLVMSAADIADFSGQAMHASSANLVQIHGHQFADDEETQRLRTFITLRKPEPAELQVVLEVPGRGLEEEMRQASEEVSRLSKGYGYSSKIVKPELNPSLQGAIQRSYTIGGTKTSTILTSETGPNGLPLVVESASGQRIRLTEVKDQNSLPPHTTEFCLKTSLTG